MTLSNILPTYYQILYFKPIIFIFVLIYSNKFQIDHLQTISELQENRYLLTVTATFTYKKELRWIWLFLALSTTVCYSGIQGQFRMPILILAIFDRFWQGA